ncbi:hypothetical protein CAOG_02146 [Capsaspora owczarzaki ATCC 30864]|uniref:Uncharacterized protein n=1 Tax=Capsaspora owczarzaki (strain ATCC 30864) TaxID=595528 RepID=A0A0D2WLR4_CAPO3|nr:hypothetical protein CAOG_02146 [Capsaspora owczarzaki ATCC 30864]KJE90913.1 hypothetical protein CAOG_002146 [Capsaspora owczarzaki ATCC 30864]|eukprot:XP_004348896.1 hypothetical protein CAOG_02146 [Capsaspora owczarzaki ATCC 30864]
MAPVRNKSAGASKPLKTTTLQVTSSSRIAAEAQAPLSQPPTADAMPVIARVSTAQLQGKVKACASMHRDGATAPAAQPQRYAGPFCAPPKASALPMPPVQWLSASGA